ncbi:hypothetical protein J7E62_27480 [Variovorax paradoxus]|nr:hypothetical protein [Variovorax paradoxus]
MSARKFKDGGVSQCFHCSAQLVRIKGGFTFAELETPDGHKVRVHKQCLSEATGHGYRPARATGSAS